jgi:hypothetical protein
LNFNFSSQVDELVRQADKDGSGSISFDEFYAILVHADADSGMGREKEEGRREEGGG